MGSPVEESAIKAVEFLADSPNGGLHAIALAVLQLSSSIQALAENVLKMGVNDRKEQIKAIEKVASELRSIDTTLDEK